MLPYKTDFADTVKVMDFEDRQSTLRCPGRPRIIIWAENFFLAGGGEVVAMERWHHYELRWLNSLLLEGGRVVGGMELNSANIWISLIADSSFRCSGGIQYHWL
jgi:hypothetical protein